MKRAFSLLLGMVCLSVIVNAQNADVASQLGYADMIVVNGKVVTMDDSSFGPGVGTIAQAMAIRGGKILRTGTNAQIQALAGPKTTKVDLKGRTMLPSFIHTHEHPTDWVWTEPSPLEHVLPSGSNDFMIVRWLKGTGASVSGLMTSATAALATISVIPSSGTSSECIRGPTRGFFIPPPGFADTRPGPADRKPASRDGPSPRPRKTDVQDAWARYPGA